MDTLLLYLTLISLVIFGVIGLCARALPSRVAPTGRYDPAEHRIIPEEWELVRREQCLGHRCPRAIGTPPRPRKDVTCEICAAMFMERYWRRLIGDGTAPTTLPGRRPALPDPRFAVRAHPSAPERPPALAERPAPETRSAIGRRRLLLCTGLAFLLLGATAVAVSSAHLIPGYLLVAAGIGLALCSAWESA